MFKEWNNFNEGQWCDEVNVRDFIQRNSATSMCWLTMQVTNPAITIRALLPNTITNSFCISQNSGNGTLMYNRIATSEIKFATNPAVTTWWATFLPHTSAMMSVHRNVIANIKVPAGIVNHPI